MTDPKLVSAKPIVFLGLSLSVVEAQQIFDADYRGPIVHGDLDAITSPARIVIIDGILDFERRLSRGEVSRALDRGVVIYGVSSIGAVFAVELEHKGLKGSGRIYQVMRALDADLENLITVLYTADQFKPMTTPLINAVVYCWEQGASSEKLHAVVHEISCIPLGDRSWEHIADAAALAGMNLPDAVRFMDVKREDAISLLKRLDRLAP